MKATGQFINGSTKREPTDILVERFLNLPEFKISIRVGLVPEWLSL